jgi:hypothetical protein
MERSDLFRNERLLFRKFSRTANGVKTFVGSLTEDRTPPHPIKDHRMIDEIRGANAACWLSGLFRIA